MIRIPGIDLDLSLYLSDEIMQVHVRTAHRKHSVNISLPSHFYICDFFIPSASFLPASSLSVLEASRFTVLYYIQFHDYLRAVGRCWHD